ncbi:hypothetical protein H0H93_007842 [Arthromyces matolae]|nr:hypothetical protein H0H93_007842 [Arthromyces matolae]
MNLYVLISSQYNNVCGVQAYDTPSWNFETWDKWAKGSKNPGVKIYIGAPASKSSALFGYVDPDKLSQIAKETRDKYSSFGGIMLWDVSSAVANDNFHDKVKAAMGSSAKRKRSEDDDSRHSLRFAKVAVRQVKTAIAWPFRKRFEHGISVTMGSVSIRKPSEEGGDDDISPMRRSDRFVRIAARRATDESTSEVVTKRSEDDGNSFFGKRRSDRFTQIAARRQGRDLS